MLQFVKGTQYTFEMTSASFMHDANGVVGNWDCHIEVKVCQLYQKDRFSWVILIYLFIIIIIIIIYLFFFLGGGYFNNTVVQ